MDLQKLLSKPNKAEQIAQQIVQRKEVQPLVETQDSIKPEHKHEWELLSKTTATPRRDIPVDNLDKDVTEKILFGATVFLWECLICKTLRKESVVGTDTPPLDEMMDKAAAYGPQYIQRADGRTFIVAEYKPQQNNNTILPMR